MTKTIEKIVIPSSAIGQSRHLFLHQYVPNNAVAESTKSVFIQASLHADELPGIMVCHHLLTLLDEADKKGLITGKITVVPYANPIGLSQILLSSHIGRFSFDTAVNFNRDWPDYSKDICDKLTAVNTLSLTDKEHNVKIIRDAMLESLSNDKKSMKEEQVMKRILYKYAAVSDIVLDLHCDTWAVMHMYTHDRLWPLMSDLAVELQSETQLLSAYSGGSPFDECCSCPWATFQDKFPDYPIPMACESVTIELRGELDVSDAFAKPDADALYRFLVGRGLIIKDASATSTTTTPLLLKRDATPLTGVDMIEATATGVVTWNVTVGDFVKKGDVLGEIINVEDHTAPRTSVTSKTDGIVFGMRSHRLVRPGQIIIKVSGEKPLEWRSGSLLTSK